MEDPMSRAIYPNSTTAVANASLAERIQSYWSALGAGDNYVIPLRSLNALPVVTAQDALATLDWLIHDGHEPLADCYGSPDNLWLSLRIVGKEAKTISTVREVVTASLIRELFIYVALTAGAVDEGP
jgi:hypothetical protein